ncbi:MAG: UPF0261 family protein [Firmicutes bacterium]|nr:UPF0261 family protein [Bacillota bacterium]
MPKTIVVVASLDTKGREVAYIKGLIEQWGHRAFLIDVGVQDEPLIPPDLTRVEVARAGGVSWEAIKDKEKRVRIEAMAKGAAVMATSLYAEGRLDGLLSLGGAQNTTIGTTAMKALPIGVPKVMVSTVASGQRTFEPLVGTKDVLLLHSVADLAGINMVTEVVLKNAVAAIVGMAEHAGRSLSPREGRPAIGATMLGVTNDGVTEAVRLLENNGFEVVTFHANGVGGRAMEELIRQGLIRATMDLTLHEITAELFGGYCTGAIGRLNAAAEAGIPQVVAPGAADVIDYTESSLNMLPDWARRKYIYQHPTILHLKLHPHEMAQVAEVIAERLNRSRGPVRVLLPLRGFCQAGFPGGPLFDPAVDLVLLETFRQKLRPGIDLLEVEANINEPAFARAAAKAMLELLS